MYNELATNSSCNDVQFDRGYQHIQSLIISALDYKSMRWDCFLRNLDIYFWGRQGFGHHDDVTSGNGWSASEVSEAMIAILGSAMGGK